MFGRNFDAVMQMAIAVVVILLMVFSAGLGATLFEEWRLTGIESPHVLVHAGF